MIVNAFNTGELSPRLLGRSDWQKYEQGCEILENFFPLVQGGVKRRPGTKYIANVKDNNKRIRLVPFVFNVNTAYALEFGEKYLRFYVDGEILTFDNGISARSGIEY